MVNRTLWESACCQTAMEFTGKHSNLRIADIAVARFVAGFNEEDELYFLYVEHTDGRFEAWQFSERGATVWSQV